MSHDIFYLDIAAVFVMAVSLLSFVMRCKSYTPANRVYLSTLLLVTIMTTLGLAGEVFDEFLGLGFTAYAQTRLPLVFGLRSAIAMLYYTLCVLTAPAYMVLIATVSYASHKLNDSVLTRILLWTPMIVVGLCVITNPLHHLAYRFVEGEQVKGPLIGLVYASAAYYSLIGIAWLIRWRNVLSHNEVATLGMMYPLAITTVYIQYLFPHLRVLSFVTSVGVLLVSAFVLRPEQQLDSLVDAASLHAYRETCRRAFITQKNLCLVYLEITNIEQLRELVGNDELQNVVRAVAKNLGARLRHGDVLYYLRNGLYCIIPQLPDTERAMSIARQTHEEAKARSRRGNNSAVDVRMRSCVVSIPQDVSDIAALNTFVRRFAHLMPEPGVTSFAELAKRDDFALQMALPSIVEQAIRDRSFQVYYQPICCLHDGRFHSAEALIRLSDPHFGWIPPSLFIPEAEQSGAIIQIGDILLDKVVAFLSSIDYGALGFSYVEVNLSVEQCVQPQLAAALLDKMLAHGVDPSRVNLEITETASGLSQEAIDINVRKLAAAGVSFSLDDYGSGYSNVARVLRLPVSLVKFDKSLVDGLDNPSVRTVLARSIAMMKEIDKEVLVEGVETAAQADALRSMGADYIQGYLYARPIAQNELIGFLADKNSK